MNRRKVKKQLTNKYYFSVEGETEKLYLAWLQAQINTSPNAKYKVSFTCKVEKSPMSYIKSPTILAKTEIWHLFDFESNDKYHQDLFRQCMDEMKEAEKQKQVTYHAGYSNFTFDLWIVLHKMDCKNAFSGRHQYITPINKAFDENFSSMDDYKHEDNFKKCLKKLNLDNVIQAIARAKAITENNQKNGYILQEYKGYHYYKENPSLSVWEIIEIILKDCGLI